MNRPLELKSKLGDSYLVQRLDKPRNFINPFSFGGGLKDGGLSIKASDILKSVFSFDYMGAAEFEWGAVPNALQFLAEQAHAKNLVAGKLTGDNATVIRYLCPKQYEAEVIERITAIENNTISLKEPHKMRETAGCLELDNGFMFFYDKEMFENTCKLFGQKVSA